MYVVSENIEWHLRKLYIQIESLVINGKKELFCNINGKLICEMKILIINSDKEQERIICDIYVAVGDAPHGKGLYIVIEIKHIIESRKNFLECQKAKKIEKMLTLLHCRKHFNTSH